MESSNTPDLAAQATTETANPVENVATESPAAIAEVEKPATLKEAILSRKAAPEATDATKKEGEVTPPVDANTPTAPAYAPNYKFKAFGKEKEIPELFRSVIKDGESEKQVREVFTRAEAFDDMKGRYENASREHQKVLGDFSALDHDVKRVTGFLNKRDLDNFFQSVRLSDNEILQYLQNKAQYMQDPALKAQYQQQVNQRAELLNREEQFEQLQTNYQTQAVQARTMQLDMVLSRPDVSGVATAWDSKAGELGSFRSLVIQEAANYYHLYKQDLPAEHAVQLALQKFGKLVASQTPQEQPVIQSQQAQGPASQAPAQTVVAAKPVIPNIQGKGTSPVKQAPKSLDDLKRMAKEAQRAEFQTA